MLLFRLNLVMLAKFAVEYGLKATRKNLIDVSEEFVRTFLQNCFTSACGLKHTPFILFYFPPFFMGEKKLRMLDVFMCSLVVL